MSWFSKNTLAGSTAKQKNNAPPEQPAIPDPVKSIEAQGRENRVNEVTPQGTLQYSKGPDGTWTATRNFSPQLQGLYDSQLGLLKTPLNTDFSAETNKAQDAMFARQKGLLDPQFALQGRELDQKLANQGLPMGSEAYNGEMNRFDKTKNEAYGTAALDSIAAGSQEQGRLFGQAQQGRSSQFNELAALLGGQQVGGTSPIDVTGPMRDQQNAIWKGYDANMNTYNQQKAQTAQNMQTAASIAGAFRCSKDWKEEFTSVDHGEVLAKLDELPVERWKYKEANGNHIGPYAEDFRSIFGLGDGKTIPMIDAIGVLMSAVKALSAEVKELKRAH